MYCIYISIMYITIFLSFKGRFSIVQAEIYEALLEVQKNCIELCSTNTSLESLLRDMLQLLGKQLQRLGMIRNHVTGTALERV